MVDILNGDANGAISSVPAALWHCDNENARHGGAWRSTLSLLHNMAAGVNARRRAQADGGVSRNGGRNGAPPSA